MKISTLLAFLSFGASAHAYVPPTMKASNKLSSTACRREVFQSAFVAATVAAVGGSFAQSANAALAPCPPNSKNCLRTVWTPPSTSSKKDAIDNLRAAILEYPQEGQQKADMGGYKIVSDDLEGASGLMRVEYTSGIGFFSKTFNGGKPFKDDLLLEVDQKGAVQVRSSSRVGESDLGVNKKRVDYLAASLTQKGWVCTVAEYGKP